MTLAPGPAAVAALAPALAHDDTLAGDVGAALAGCRLYAVEEGGRQVGAFALRFEHCPAGVEAVIVAGAGRLPGVSLLETIVPHIEDSAGADFIRVHTARPGLVKQLRAQGYEAVEVVLRKRVKHGR